MLLWKYRWDSRVWRTSTIVSILVLLDVALKELVEKGLSRCNGVSILVLLDVALKDGLAVGGSFAKVLFQSLFSWMLLWKEMANSYQPTYWVEFQSLFSWMLLWKQYTQGARRQWSEKCFNPCSLGCCSESQLHPRKQVVASTFQSLFSWMLLWKVLPPASESCTSICRFQSLFSWMLLWKDEWAYSNPVLGDVSILVLLDVALKGLDNPEKIKGAE